MIILRQKEYSTLLGRTIAGINKNILRKPKLKSYRSAIKSQNKVLNKISKGLESVKGIYYTPGEILNKGISETIKNPITVLGVIAGKVTDVTNPETIAIPKSTIAAIIGNKVIPNKLKNNLVRVSENYEKTKISKLVKRSPSIPEIATIVSELGRGSGI